MPRHCRALTPLLLTALSSCALLWPDPTVPRLVAIEKIWDRAQHNAFTSLIAAHGRYYCSFREGERHVHGADGRVRVLVSDDLRSWRSSALLDCPGVDLRDPKLSQMPDGRLLLTIGGSHYEDGELLRQQPMVALSDAEGREFPAPEPARIDPAIAGDADWLWRVTWHDGTGYGVVYQSGPEERKVQLVATRDGRDYGHVAQLDLTGRPSEVTLRFLDDDRMVALVRRDGGNKNAAIGSSSAPYTEWTWRELPVRLGGPDFAVMRDGRMLGGGRGDGDKSKTTVLGWLDLEGNWQHILTFPSGGDTSYPGIVVEEDRLLVSYYSSHEGKAAIYLATLRPPVQELRHDTAAPPRAAAPRSR